MLHDLPRQLRRLLNEATRSNPAQDSERNVIRVRHTTIAGWYRKPQDWQQRLLTKLGARMHATSVERGDGCSIAILDSGGTVVAWHDTLPGAAKFDFGVVGTHVSQFYLAQDVAFQRPNRRMHAASLHGTDTQQGWHRRPDGTIFWGVTVVEAMRLKTGELHGYSHVTRQLQEPRARVSADARRALREYPPCYGAVA